jgi:hypothetical protein
VTILRAKIPNARIQISKFKALSCLSHLYSVHLDAITTTLVLASR